jgi:anionic cell wall polymer biosynthesis LytR-Cps2A-Psr (LCP) family protein
MKTEMEYAKAAGVDFGATDDGINDDDVAVDDSAVVTATAGSNENPTAVSIKSDTVEPVEQMTVTALESTNKHVGRDSG